HGSRLGLGLIALCSSAPAVLAQVTLLTQSRGLHDDMSWMQEDPLPPSHGLDRGDSFCPTFGEYSTSEHVQIPMLRPAITWSEMSQHSTLAINDIFGTGAALARLTVPEDHVSANSHTSSFMTIGFRVDSRVRYHFAAGISLIVQDATYSLSSAE